MKKMLGTFLLLALLACGARVNHTESFALASTDTVPPTQFPELTTDDSLMRAEEPDAFLDCFLVIADTSRNYLSLRLHMLQLHDHLKLPIDTLGRTYDTTEGAIVYADSFATEQDNSYFPRRYPDSSLSLEYLRAYTEHADPKTIALVTGIYEEKKDAAAALARLKRNSGRAFMIPATVYLGCMN